MSIGKNTINIIEFIVQQILLILNEERFSELSPREKLNLRRRLRNIEASIKEPNISVERLLPDLDFIEHLLAKENLSSKLSTNLNELLSIMKNLDQTELIFGHIDTNKIDNIIEGKLKQLEKRQSTLLANINEMTNNYEKTISDYERKLAISFNKKLEEFDNIFSSRSREELEKINKINTDLIGNINDGQQKIMTIRHMAEKDLIDSINTAQVDAKNLLVDMKHSTLIEINKRIKSEISIFLTANKQLNKLLSAAGTDLLAKDNLAQAERERSAANWLRGFGVILLFFAVSYIAYEVVQLMKDSASATLENVMIRIVITFVLMLPSIYLLKESSRHRADERKFRKTGINLATIDSYLSNFDEISKVDIKRQLTANFFDNGEKIVDYSTVPDIQSIVEKTIETLMPNNNAYKINKTNNLNEPELGNK
ncbi:hypothetical protein [Aeromonas enteropelogenes]|nr:hypothetical protein [Aeromonas enteropelogenes]